MQTYLILRRGGWATPQDLKATAARSAAEGDQMPDDIRWIRASCRLSVTTAAVPRSSRPRSASMQQD